MPFIADFHTHRQRLEGATFIFYRNMKRIFLLLLFLLTGLILKSQVWTYEQGGTVFDGKYKTSSVIGKGSEFPYESPVFVINVFRGDTANPNIYLSRVPCACCDNLRALLKFDNEDDVYNNVIVTTNAEKDEWFLQFNNSIKVQYDKVKKAYVYWDTDLEKWARYDSVYTVKQLSQFMSDVKLHSRMYVEICSVIVKSMIVSFRCRVPLLLINFVLKK